MKRTTQKFLAVAATAAISLLSAAAALAGPAEGQRLQAGGKEAFIPGVTDFPARPAVFIRGVTDFPSRPAIEIATDSGSGASVLDWSEAGIAAGAIAVLALLALAGVAALRRRSRALLGTAA